MLKQKEEVSTKNSTKRKMGKIKDQGEEKKKPKKTNERESKKDEETMKLEHDTGTSKSVIEKPCQASRQSFEAAEQLTTSPLPFDFRNDELDSNSCLDEIDQEAKVNMSEDGETVNSSQSVFEMSTLGSINNDFDADAIYKQDQGSKAPSSHTSFYLCLPFYQVYLSILSFAPFTFITILPI